MRIRARAISIDLRRFGWGGPLLQAFPLRSPLAVGLAVGGTLLAAFFTGQVLLGRFPFGPAGTLSDVLIAALHCVLLAYLCAAYLAVIRSAERVIAAVEPHLQKPLPTADLLRLPPVGRPGWGWIGAALAGLTFTFFGPYLTEPELMGPFEFWDPVHWVPENAWHRVLGLGIGVWLGWFAYATFRISERISRLAQQLDRVDLFDPRALYPFAQQGLNHALLTAGLLSLASLFALDHGLTLMLLLLSGSAVVLIGIAVLLPVLGIHRRIRREKKTELGWCDAQLRWHRDVLRGPAGTEPSGRLADLAAYRALVAQVPEWPFDSPAFRRILLYLCIPLGSWMASALVQSALEHLLFSR